MTTCDTICTMLDIFLIFNVDKFYITNIHVKIYKNLNQSSRDVRWFHTERPYSMIRFVIIWNSLEKMILLRKGPQKIFPHHFFSYGPVIIWTCWCEKNTWKIEKSSISIFYEFFILAKNVFDRNKKIKNTLKYFLRKKFKN